MDSHNLKYEAFCYALKPFSFSSRDIRELHTLHTGVSRRKLLSLMYEQLSGHKISAELTCELTKRFTECDEANRAGMTLIPGTLSFLELVSPYYYTAIVTGTPQVVIEKTVQFHNLSTYFDDVRGGPQTKQSIVKDLIKQHNLSTDQCIFIGDGKVDQDTAEAFAIRFVGMARTTVSFEHDRAWLVVPSLMDLLPHLGDSQ